METISTMIGTIVTYLGKKLAKEKSVKGFLSELTEESVNWIKPLFLRSDDSEKDLIQELKEKPDSNSKKKVVVAAFESQIEENKELAEKHIQSIFEQITKTEEGKQAHIHIQNSKNVVIGDISVGGDFHVGDNVNQSK